MSQSTPLREFVRYSALSSCGMIAVSCYILADTFFVAQGLGTAGLAALNLAIPIYNFIHGTGLMLGMAGPPNTPFIRAGGTLAALPGCSPACFFCPSSSPSLPPAGPVLLPWDHRPPGGPTKLCLR